MDSDFVEIYQISKVKMFKLNPARTKFKVQFCSYTHTHTHTHTHIYIYIYIYISHHHINSQYKVTFILKFLHSGNKTQPAIRPAKFIDPFTHIPVWKPQYVQPYTSEPGNVTIVRLSPRKLMVCDPFAIPLTNVHYNHFTSFDNADQKRPSAFDRINTACI